MLSYLLTQFQIKMTISITANRFLKNVCINQLNNNDKTFFDCIMLRFGQTKIAKKEFHGGEKEKKIGKLMFVIQLSQN